MPNGDTVTKVRFDLWVVLGALVFMGVSSFTFLFAEARGTQKIQAEIVIRVSLLEAQTRAILDGINELKTGQIKVTEALNAHEKSSVDALLRVKKWNDIK